MPTEEIQIRPILTDYELRMMKTTSIHTKMSRFIFKSIHKFAALFKLKRLGFWKFAEDYLNCDLIGG